MTGPQCLHCGQQHAPGSVFCPVTGRPLSGAASAQPSPGGAPPYPQPQQAPYGHAAGYAPAPPGAMPPAAPGQGVPPAYGAPQGYGAAPGYGAPAQGASPGQGAPAGPGVPPGYGAQAGYHPSGPGNPAAPGYGAGYGAPPAYGAGPAQGAAGGYGAPPQGYGAPGYGPAAGVPVPGQRTAARAAKPIGTIVNEAFQLYQKHFVTLILTCAVLLVPASLVKSAAMALILAPTVAVDAAAKNAERLSQRTATQLQRQLEEAQRDPQKFQQMQRENEKQMRELAGSWAATGTAAVTGFMAVLLGLVALIFGVAFLYGLAIPLTTGALTVMVADRATGGQAGPGQAWGLLLRRLGKLLGATVPAFFLVLFGFCLCILPGIVLGFLFAFVTPVVLLENLGGTAALKRSAALVKANVPQVLLVYLVFLGIRLVASFTTRIFIPSTALFLDSLVEDALMILLLPIPIVGTVLLYLDIRRQADGLDDNALRAGVEGLRRA